MAGDHADPKAGDAVLDCVDHNIVARDQHATRLIVDQRDQPSRIGVDAIGVDASDLVLHLNEIVLRRLKDLVAIILPAMTAC